MSLSEHYQNILTHNRFLLSFGDS